MQQNATQNNIGSKMKAVSKQELVAFFLPLTGGFHFTTYKINAI